MEEADKKYVNELESLELKQSPESSPKAESSDDEKIVEKDGELYFLSDSGDGEAETAPAGEKAAEESQQDAGSGENFDPKGTPYEGKSIDDVIEMHRNAETKIQDQGKELGDFRKKSSDEDISEEEALDRLSSMDLKHGISEEKRKLAELDPYDEVPYNAQLEAISQLENDLITKITQESIADRYNSRDNERFVREQKQKFADAGIELKDEEFDKVVESSRSYNEDGLLTERSFHKGLLDNFNVEMVTKLFTMKGEMKARTDIQNASAKTSERVDVRGSGKGSKLVKITDMGSRERRKALEGLSPNELKDLYSRLNK